MNFLSKLKFCCVCVCVWVCVCGGGDLIYTLLTPKEIPWMYNICTNLNYEQNCYLFLFLNFGELITNCIHNKNNNNKKELEWKY